MVRIKEKEFKKTFEEYLPLIQSNIQKRKGSWTIPSLEWEDVSQILIIKLFNKFDKYSPSKGPFEHWMNRLISNTLANLIRDSYAKFSKPCTCGCVYYEGNDDCSYTKSKKQCSECPLFKSWAKKRQQQYNLVTSVSLENHSNETYQVENDTTNFETSKHIIEDRLKELLPEREWNAYVMMFIEHRPLEYVGKKLGYKLLPSSHIPGYQELLKLKRKFIDISREIILDEIL